MRKTPVYILNPGPALGGGRQVSQEMIHEEDLPHLKGARLQMDVDLPDGRTDSMTGGRWNGADVSAHLGNYSAETEWRRRIRHARARRPLPASRKETGSGSC